MKIPTTTVLVILDGWGLANIKQKGNAITPTTAPHFFSWLKKYPNSQLSASGADVGLFKGQEGNSEAGHLNIGAGRVVKQDALYISDAIQDGTFFKNNAFQEALHHVEKYNSAVHVMGLLSNHNSAHSCPEHLYALLDLFHSEGVQKVYLHLFTDGRDSGQHDAHVHLTKLAPHLYPEQKIATIMGRLYGMDRNKNWDRTKIAFNTIVSGKAEYKAASAALAIDQAYSRGESDEFIVPTVIGSDSEPAVTVADNDVIFFFNLRSDRARQITKVFTQPNFEAMNPESFKRTLLPKNIRFVALTDFGPDLPGVLTAFPSRDVDESLVATLCPRRQLYVAESEKFAHITYFLNGGYAQHFCDERWVKIESDRITDFQTDPGMKAKEIAHYVSRAITNREFEFIAVNFSNADMLGHTGNSIAAAAGVTIVDRELNELVEAALSVNARVVITADHGNAEDMINAATGEPDSEHSANPVPCVIIATSAELKRLKLGSRKKLKPGKLADIAPTILKLMNIVQPKVMTGKSLF